jgi:superfamily I DNA/RNA helicase
MEAYHDGKTAEEHRLYYVGVTRASEELRIVRDFFDTETFPVFERFEQPVNPLEVVV